MAFCVEPSSISCMLPMAWPITLRYITRLLTTNMLGNHPPKPAPLTFFSMLLRASMRSFLYRIGLCHSASDWGESADMVWNDEMQIVFVWYCTDVATEQHLVRVILARTSRHRQSGQHKCSPWWPAAHQCHIIIDYVQKSEMHRHAIFTQQRTVPLSCLRFYFLTVDHVVDVHV